MEKGKSTAGPDRPAEIAQELSDGAQRLIALYQELLLMARADEGQRRRILDLLVELVPATSRPSHMHSDLVAALVDDQLTRSAVAISRAAAPPDAVRVEVTLAEFDDLVGRPRVWELGLSDPEFDPPLSPGQRFVLALLQVLVVHRRRAYLDVTLPRLMDLEYRTNNITGTRKDAMWLLRRCADLPPERIAELFGLAIDTVKTYISEWRLRAMELLPLAERARNLAQLDRA